MKKSLKEIALQYHDSIVNFSGFLSVSLVFASGIGRYRCVVAFGAYWLLKTLTPLLKINEKIYLLFFPSVVITLFLDITRGPIVPLFTKNYLLVALPVMIVLDDLFRKACNKMIINITESHLFVVCPACNYNNKDLVEECLNCS